MKKVFFVLLIIGVGVFAYLFMVKKPVVQRCGEGFRFVPSSQTCEPVEKPQENTTVDLSQYQIMIPESQNKVSLSQEGNTTKYSAAYNNSDSKVTEYISIDSKDVLNVSTEFSVVPLTYNSGGTGNFTYITLLDLKNKTNTSSIYVGDRISISSIVVVNGKIKINYKDRLDTESFATAPSIPSQLVLEIKDSKLVEIVRLQNADYSDVEIKSVAIDNSASSTLVVKGAIPGNWYFEASAQFRILDDKLQEIALGNIQALSDWMTTQRVPFELKVPLSTINYKGKATIVIESENVRGDEEGERLVKKIKIPIEI